MAARKPPAPKTDPAATDPSAEVEALRAELNAVKADRDSLAQRVAALEGDAAVGTERVDAANAALPGAEQALLDAEAKAEEASRVAEAADRRNTRVANRSASTPEEKQVAGAEAAEAQSNAEAAMAARDEAEKALAAARKETAEAVVERAFPQARNIAEMLKSLTPEGYVLVRRGRYKIGAAKKGQIFAVTPSDLADTERVPDGTRRVKTGQLDPQGNPVFKEVAQDPVPVLGLLSAGYVEEIDPLKVTAQEIVELAKGGIYKLG